MNVGDLVELESWCKNKFRKAIVVEVPEYLSCVKIVYLDTGEISNALNENLKVLCESR
jgi:hypothetical protein